MHRSVHSQTFTGHRPRIRHTHAAPISHLEGPQQFGWPAESYHSILRAMVHRISKVSAAQRFVPSHLQIKRSFKQSWVGRFKDAKRQMWRVTKFLQADFIFSSLCRISPQMNDISNPRRAAGLPQSSGQTDQFQFEDVQTHVVHLWKLQWQIASAIFL